MNVLMLENIYEMISESSMMYAIHHARAAEPVSRGQHVARGDI
jgi:hypothetical protein